MKWPTALMTWAGCICICTLYLPLYFPVIIDFDTLFRQTNAEGNLEDWWHPETATRSDSTILFYLYPPAHTGCNFYITIVIVNWKVPEHGQVHYWPVQQLHAGGAGQPQRERDQHPGIKGDLVCKFIFPSKRARTLQTLVGWRWHTKHTVRKPNLVIWQIKVIYRHYRGVWSLIIMWLNFLILKSC